MRYSVGGLITISVNTEVEADKEEAAVAIAKRRGLMSLCSQCARGEPTEEWVTSGEPDAGEVEPPDGVEFEVIEL